MLTMWTWCSFLVASERISPLEQLNRPVPKLLDEIFFSIAWKKPGCLRGRLLGKALAGREWTIKKLRLVGTSSRLRPAAAWQSPDYGGQAVSS